MSACLPSSSIRSLTAVLPAESAAVEALRAALCEEGIASFIAHRARGALPGSPLNRKNQPIWQEMIILEAIVPAEDADRIFQHVYAKSMAAEDASGLLFMGRPGRGSLA